MSVVRYHTHSDDQGVLHRCYHRCRTALFSTGFWIGVTFSFPIEHGLWDKVWPFYLLTHWMGI